MSSYYKQINGTKYDRALLEYAQSLQEGARDGRISGLDGEKIAAKRYDGTGSTPTETLTMRKIKRDMNITGDGLEAMATTSRRLSHLPSGKRNAEIGRIMRKEPRKAEPQAQRVAGQHAQHAGHAGQQSQLAMRKMQQQG